MMTNDLNQCTFIGRAGKDCELKFLPNGNPVANFSLAVGRSWKDSNGTKQEETSWLNIVIFGKLAEQVAAKYVAKGKQLLVSGRLRIRKYQDRDGSDKYSTEIIADNLQLLGSKSEGQSNQQPAQRQSQQNNNQAGPRESQYQQQRGGFEEPVFDDGSDIPF